PLPSSKYSMEGLPEINITSRYRATGCARHVVSQTWRLTMSIKRILVPLSGTSASSTLLQTAVEVAKLFEGHLEVLHLQPDLQRRLNEVAHGEGANLDESRIREVIEAAELDAARTRGAFEEIMRRQPISLGDDPSVRPAASWREASGGAD